jgi:toxin-antitoxin system PIN domain toxin
LSLKFLLDTNVLIALTETGHVHHRRAQEWLNSLRSQVWGICPLTEAGFLRIVTNARSYSDPHNLAEAAAILQVIKGYPRFIYWSINESWVNLTASFASRISGHQQVTDAYLLGVAIQGDGVLVTFDRGIRYMAGAEFSRNVLILQKANGPHDQTE